MSDYPTHTPNGTPITEMSFDCLAAQLSSAAADGATYWIDAGEGWHEITRFSYDSLLEIGVDVKLARASVSEGGTE